MRFACSAATARAGLLALCVSAATAAVASAAVAAAVAAEHLVLLVTEGAHGRFRFEPPVVLAATGDSVRFVPDSRLHAVKTVAGMLPAGASPWRGRMGEEVAVRFDRPGVYGLKCPAHYQVGMVALVIVGRDPANFGEARSVRHPPMPTETFGTLFAEAACELGGTRPAGCGD
jgi:pseudoazurin